MNKKVLLEKNCLKLKKREYFVKKKSIIPAPTQSGYAQVVKLVDTLASGASDRKVVEVQVLSWAPYLSN